MGIAWRRGMFHYVFRAVDGTVLFHDHIEAQALWERLIRAAPGPIAAFLMPDHGHTLYAQDRTEALRRAASAYARWRNHRRGTTGPVFARMPAPELVPPGQKRRRSVRYVHLNGCRKRLHDDPLSWPWSTHRDAVGLAAWPVRPAERDPHAFHAYVSADPSVCVTGTLLPTHFGGVLDGVEGMEALVAAVSAVTRTPVLHLRERGAARTGLVRAARLLGRWTDREVGELAAMSTRNVRRVEPIEDPVVRAAMGVIGDPRFRPLQPGDLRPGWWPYRLHG